MFLYFISAYAPILSQFQLNLCRVTYPACQVDLGSNRSVGTVVLWDSETEPIKRQLAVQEITVMFDDGRGYADASVVGADTNSSFTLPPPCLVKGGDF